MTHVFFSSCLHDHLSSGPRSHKKCKTFLRAMHRSSSSNLITAYTRWNSDHMRAGNVTDICTPLEVCCYVRFHQRADGRRWFVEALSRPRISSWSARLQDGMCVCVAGNCSSKIKHPFRTWFWILLFYNHSLNTACRIHSSVQWSYISQMYP